MTDIHWYPESETELEARFHRFADLHSLCCLDCGSHDKFADPMDLAARDRLYNNLQKTANALISDDQVYDLEHEAKAKDDRDTLHFCQLALHDNDPYARFECYRMSRV